MEKSDFFLVTAHDGKRWLDDEIHQTTPIPAVRKHLGGRWERKAEYQPDVHAYFGTRNRRVLVMGFPPGTTKEKAYKALAEIQAGREDVS